MKKEDKLIIFFLISTMVLVGFISAAYFSGVFENIYYQPPACIDSDVSEEYPDGENPFVAGSVTTYDEFEEPFVQEDFCDTDVLLKEYMCWVDDVPILEGVTCEIGCENGVCLQECMDTCDSLGHECGTQTICGKQSSCGTCPEGKSCSAGECFPENICSYELRLSDNVIVDGKRIKIRGVNNGRLSILVESESATIPRSETRVVNGLRIKNRESQDSANEYHVYGRIAVVGENCGEIESEVCSDGTFYELCSDSQPKFCNDRGELVSDCHACGCEIGFECEEDTGSCLPISPEVCEDETSFGSCSDIKPTYCSPEGKLENNCSLCGCPEETQCNTLSLSCEETLEGQEVFVFSVTLKEDGEVSLNNVLIDADSEASPTSQTEGSYTLTITSEDGEVLHTQKVDLSSGQEEIIAPYFENAETVEIYNELDGRLALSTQIDPELPKRINSLLIFSILGGMAIFLSLLLAIYYFIINDS